MSDPAPRILAFAGSLRTGSYNKKLVTIAGEAARAAGALVTYIDLRDFPMPIFDEDIESEHGLHPNARKLQGIMLENDGFLIACPEYNSSITAVLKNTIDWTSRGFPGQTPLACYAGKVVGLMSASPGALGGLRGLVTVRSILGNISCIVIPEQIAVPKAHELFQEDGSLKDAGLQAGVARVGQRVAGVISKLKY